MDNKKNAVLHLVWTSEDYPEVDLTFKCDEDLSITELVVFFRQFALAMGYIPEQLDECLIGDDSF